MHTGAPALAVQASTVQGLPSEQAGVCVQVPSAAHASMVHTFRSSHLAGWVQVYAEPVPAAHTSVVQGFVSSQTADG